MSEQPTAPTNHVRRVLLVITVAASLALSAAPALAQPEGWSEPDPVDPMRALLIFVFAPLALALLITLLAVTPRLVRGQREEPSLTAPAAVGSGQRRPELEA